MGGELVADRVEVDEGSGPCGLQSGLGAADVATLAGVVAVREESEQPFDPWPGAPQMLSGGGVLKCLPRGDQKLLVGVDLDHPECAARPETAGLQRTIAAQ